MSEAENPVLHISGTLTIQSFKESVRNWRLRIVALLTIVFLIMLLLIPVFVSLLEWFTHHRDIPNEMLGTWILTYILLSISSPATLIWFAAAIVLNAVNNLVIMPARAAKRLRERNPDGVPFVYDFYEDHLEIRSVSQSSDETVRLNYADIQHKIRESRYMLVLSTCHRNLYSLYKTIMSPEEASQMTELLRARCPQRRSRS